MGEVLILLGQRELAPKCERYSTRLQIEENVGEDVHIHYRNMRLEFAKGEFMEFALVVEEALQRLFKQKIEENKEGL